MNKFASVLTAIALAATSGASSAVEETTDKRNAHRTQASKHYTDATNHIPGKPKPTLLRNRTRLEKPK
jgi:hypothetical protein